MSPKVSVVIPVFNRPASIRRAIESVLAQTFQDFEIVVVDDASTDASAVAVASFTDPRITLIRHARNRGGSAARNTGIHAGSAPLVAFLDSDDEWMPTKLQRQIEVFERSDERLGMVYTGFEMILADGCVVRHIPREYGDLVRTLLSDNVIGGTSVGMVRRQVFADIGGFDEALTSAQDVDLWLRICERFHASFIPAVLVRLWQSNDGARISSNVAATLMGREMFYEKHRQALMRSRVSHIQLREIGWMHHRAAGDLRRARRFYLKAIAAKPVAPLSYLLLLASCLPTSCLDQMARCKHLLTGWLRPRDLSRADSSYPRA